MAVRKILTIKKHEKILRTKSDPVSKINREIKALFQDLRDTMEEHPAIGLAAPQIGVMKRVFAARMGYYDDQTDEEQQPPTIFVNPEIVQEEGIERGSDGCLSMPGLMGFTDRILKIRLKYTDEHGVKQDRMFEGWDARVIQHELDHLNGILFTDRLSSLDDLYVVVTNDDGLRETIPYSEFMKQTAEEIEKG